MINYEITIWNTGKTDIKRDTDRRIVTVDTPNDLPEWLEGYGGYQIITWKNNLFYGLENSNGYTVFVNFQPSVFLSNFVTGILEQAEQLFEEQLKETTSPPPEPETPEDWGSFQIATRNQYKIIINESLADEGSKAVLKNWVSRMPVPDEVIPWFIEDWNAVVEEIPDDIEIDWQAVKDSACTFNCTVFENMDLKTGIIAT